MFTNEEAIFFDSNDVTSLGEKLHEAMISETESFRTEECDRYYMITDEIINNKCWSFTSDQSLMESEETDVFLKESKVI